MIHRPHRNDGCLRLLGLLGLLHFSAYPSATGASLLDLDTEADPDGSLGLRVLAKDSAPATWRLFETGLGGDGGRFAFYFPGTVAPTPQPLACWSVVVEAGGYDAFAASFGRAGTMRIDDAETPGFTITFRYEGCDTALPYEFVDIDTHGLLFRFDRQPDPERELVPLDLVFAEVYGTVFQAGTFVATGFDAFEIQVPAIPEPSSRVLLAGGLLLALVARTFRGGHGFS